MSAPPEKARGAPRRTDDQSLSDRLDDEMRRLRAMREVARALGSTLDLDRLLELILQHTTEVMEADRATLYLTTDDGEGLWSRVTQGGERITIRLRLGEGIAGSVAKENRSLRVDDAYADPRFNRSVDQASGYVTRTILCSPLRGAAGKIVGVIQVLNRKEGLFSADDEALLEALASQAAVSIENSKLYSDVVRERAELLRTHAQLTERVGELDLLYQLAREVHEAHDLDEVLDRLLGKAIERVGADAGSILLQERPGGVLHFRAARGAKSGAVKQLLLPAGEGVAGWVAQTGTPVIVNDPASEPRFHRQLADQIGFRPSSILCVPLPSDEGTLGSFELLSKRDAAGFDDDDLRLATLIAGQASSAIQLARSRDERLKEGRLASIGQILSGLLHDFKTPMTVVSGYAQMMAVTDDRERRERHAAEVLKQLELMNGMTREVLAFARGETKLLLRKVTLPAFLREMDTQLGPGLLARGVALVIDASERGTVVLDEAKWMRVVHNLARNAAEAMPEGGTFRVGVARDGTDLLWTFTDTGIGIPIDVQRRLFQAFASSGKPEGTGLGLAIVKKIVEDHAGRISYVTEAGRGTTFALRIPQSPREDKEG